MLRKLLVVLLALTLTAPAFAQQAVRVASGAVAERTGQTIMSNLLLTGGPGQAPAYIALKGQSAAVSDYTAANLAEETIFYLWVGSDSSLRIASKAGLGVFPGNAATPPTVYWRDSSGPKVGP